MNTGTKIKELRTEKGWTQSELASKVGYADKTAIAKVEKNNVDLPQSKIKAFADIFGVSISYLIDDEQAPKTIAAHKHVSVEGLHDEQVDDVNRYIEFLKSKKRL